MKTKWIGLIVLSLLVMGTVYAEESREVAKIGKVDGVVVINQGERFVQAHRGMPVYRGDRIFVMEGATAELAYVQRCRLRLSSNSFLQVGSADECVTGHVRVSSFGPHYAAAIGLDTPTTTDADEEGGSEAVKAEGAANGGAAASAGGGAAALAVPATLSGVVLYALIAAGGGAKGTPQQAPISAQ